jgi:hypothetical protein
MIRSEDAMQVSPQPPEDPPPFWGAWWRIYAAVLAWLAFLILLFAWFSRRLAP